MVITMAGLGYFVCFSGLLIFKGSLKTESLLSPFGVNVDVGVVDAPEAHPCRSSGDLEIANKQATPTASGQQNWDI